MFPFGNLKDRPTMHNYSKMADIDKENDSADRVEDLF
jgi:hypothetical protein